ncbi:MAG: leucine--tRNA ligase [Candidatus Paceibacterota bacterium]
MDAYDPSKLPQVIDKKNPPRSGKKTIERRTIHAIVHDPKTNKFLGLKWKKFDWHTFIVGGVEPGEDLVEAAKREVLEETGYSDIKLVKVLGEPIRAEYFAAHKDENRVAITTSVLFELVSETRKEVAREEKEKHEAVWLDYGQLNSEVMTCAELPFTLNRIDQALNITGPHSFSTTVGEDAVKPELPFVERNAVMAIIKHWSEDKYLGLKWKKVDWQTFVTGGPEDNQTLEEAAKMEIVEETGYLNPKLIKKIGNVDAKFFHIPKKVNRFAHFNVFYFELADNKHQLIEADDQSRHEVVWLSRDEMTNFLSSDGQRYAWAKFLDEKYGNQKPLLLDWPESIKTSQKNWIGRSEGVNLKFKVKDLDLHFEMYDSIPQTFMAQTFTVIAPEHKAIIELVKGTDKEKEVMAFVEAIKRKKATEGFDHIRDMEGIFTGRYIEYGPANRLLPIWVASYALADYGSGIVNCSYHDERDYIFAKKYKIPLHPVLFPKDETLADKVRKQEIMYREPDGILEEPVEFKGRRWDEAREDIIDFIEKNGWGKRTVQFKLRDWVFSRQRYWGEPIPLIHCENCAKNNPASQGVVPVPEKDLPVVLPKVKSYEPTGTGESPLAAIEKWVNVKCPVCKGPAKRETNTMPQWAGSSWYYLRYMDPKNKKALVDAKKEKYWAPVDIYVGGAEHATRHLIYARFWHKFLYDQGLVSTIEPFTKLQHVGLIMGEDGRKMSKRFGNVINPDDIAKTYGADTLRLYEMFMGPFDQQIAWSTSSIVGTRRFIEKVWKLKEKVATGKKLGVLPGNSSQSPETNRNVQRTIHKTIKKVTEDIESMRYNTAISSLMIAVNELEKTERLSKTDYESLLKLIAPFAPHFTEEIWTNIGNKKSIHISSWPVFDSTLTESDQVKIMVQVSGRIRGSFMVSTGAAKGELEKASQEVPEVKKWLEGKEVLKIIVVPDKMVSLVVKD